MFHHCSVPPGKPYRPKPKKPVTTCHRHRPHAVMRHQWRVAVWYNAGKAKEVKQMAKETPPSGLILAVCQNSCSLRTRCEQPTSLPSYRRSVRTWPCSHPFTRWPEEGSEANPPAQTTPCGTSWGLVTQEEAISQKTHTSTWLRRICITNTHEDPPRFPGKAHAG